MQKVLQGPGKDLATIWRRSGDGPAKVWQGQHRLNRGYQSSMAEDGDFLASDGFAG